MSDAAGAPLVSVVVVTWNSRADALRCLSSVIASGVSCEIIVVDNGSTDGTTDAVRGAFPDATVLEGHGNIGFPAANNLALRRARGPYVLFLNPDTELHEGTLEACVAALDADTSIGMVGCRLVYADGTTQLESARNTYRLGDLLAESLWLHMFFPRSPIFARHLIGEWDHLGERDVDAISGAFMLVRRDIAEALGGLPEDVFMYHEDLSFCLRVRRAGWRIRYLGDVTATHFSGQSAARSPAMLYLLEGEVKLRLIREAQGRGYAAAGRALFAFRSLLRVAIAVAGNLVPGAGRLRHRYPKVFFTRMHALHLVWSIWPAAVRKRLPQQAPGVAGSDDQT